MTYEDTKPLHEHTENVAQDNNNAEITKTGLISPSFNTKRLKRILRFKPQEINLLLLHCVQEHNANFAGHGEKMRPIKKVLHRFQITFQDKAHSVEDFVDDFNHERDDLTTKMRRNNELNTQRERYLTALVQQIQMKTVDAERVRNTMTARVDEHFSDI